MGGPDSEGHPNRHGFDYFYGYLGQGHAHSYYPPFLFENNEKIMLEKKHYSHNLIVEKALDFIDKMQNTRSSYISALRFLMPNWRCPKRICNNTKGNFRKNLSPADIIAHNRNHGLPMRQWSHYWIQMSDKSSSC